MLAFVVVLIFTLFCELFGKTRLNVRGGLRSLLLGSDSANAFLRLGADAQRGSDHQAGQRPMAPELSLVLWLRWFCWLFSTE